MITIQLATDAVEDAAQIRRSRGRDRIANPSHGIEHEPPDRAGGSLWDVRGGFDYDSARAQYVCGDGALCSLTLLSGTTPQRLIHIYGEKRSVTVDMLSQTIVDLDRDYAASSLNRARNNIDRVSGTIDNGLSVARRKFDSGWEAQKRLNPHYYQFDEEVELLEAEDRRTEPPERARWTISILDQIRSSSDPGGTRRMNSKAIEGQ